MVLCFVEIVPESYAHVEPKVTFLTAVCTVELGADGMPFKHHRDAPKMLLLCSMAKIRDLG